MTKTNANIVSFFTKTTPVKKRKSNATSSTKRSLVTKKTTNAPLKKKASIVKKKAIKKKKKEKPIYQTQGLYFDVFINIFNCLGLRDKLATGCVCKEWDDYSKSFIKKFKNIKAGTTKMKIRQIMALEEIQRELLREQTILFRGYMSFGKTLLSLKVAEKNKESGWVWIIVPPSIVTSWYKQCQTHYQQATTSKDSKKFIYFGNSTSQIAKVFEIERSEGFTNKILITSLGKVKHYLSGRQPKIPNLNLIIIDEPQKYKATVESIVSSLNVKILCMSASIPHFLQHHNVKIIESTENSSSLPKVTVNIVKDSFNNFINIVRNNIINSPDSHNHTIVVMHAKPRAKFLNSDFPGVRGVYNYCNTSRIQYGKFASSGGLLYTSVHAAMQGVNFTECDNLYVQIPGTILIDNIKQLIGRVRRDGSLYQNINVTLFPEEFYGWLRCELSGLSCDGYDIDRDKALLKYTKIENIYPRLTDDEKFFIFCYKEKEKFNTASHEHDVEKIVNFTKGELVNLML